MDYDSTSIPETYDAGRDLSGAEKRAQLAFFADHVPADEVSSIIDLGCGTGRFSNSLSVVFDASVVGIDPSEKMLAQAGAKATGGRVRFERSSGDALPFADASVDLVFMSLVLHHLPEPDRVARECARVLRAGGTVCIRSMMVEEISSYPYLAFFPSIRAIIQGRLMSRERSDLLFRAAGLDLAARSIVRHQLAPDWPAYADKIALKADSFVARLSDEEFGSGLDALRAHAATAPAGEAVGLNLDQFIYRRR